MLLPADAGGLGCELRTHAPWLRPAFNVPCADRPENFVNGMFVQSALRELRAIFSLPRVWLVFVVAVVLFTATGPFGTSETLALHSRLGYWLLIHALTWALALVFAAVFDVLLADAISHALPRMLVGAALAALPMGLAIAAVNSAVLAAPFSAGTWVAGVVDALPISLALCVLVWLALDAGAARDHAPGSGFASSVASRSATPDKGLASAPPPRAAILDRLPAKKRGRLVRLEVQDHYVLVITGAGGEMVLMRLADAVRETAPVDGMQVHRSHWVARDGIVRLERGQGGKLVIVTTDGAAVPVSRANAAGVRAWIGGGERVEQARRQRA